jgi:hypothetical protein
MHALIVAAIISAQANVPLSVDQLAYTTKQVQRETDLLIVESMAQLYRIGRLVPVAEMREFNSENFARIQRSNVETLDAAHAMQSRMAYDGYLTLPLKATVWEAIETKRVIELDKMELQQARLELKQLKLQDELDKLGPDVAQNDLKRVGLQLQIAEIQFQINQLNLANSRKELPAKSPPPTGLLAEALAAIRAHSEMCAVRDDVKRAIERLAKEPSAK